MAETKKPSTQKKDDSKNTEKDVNINDILKIVEELKASNEKLKEKVEKKETPVLFSNNNNFGSKRVKCVSLVHNPINVSTEPDAKGKIFSFNKYGDVRLIKFDELNDIVASYPNTMSQGLIYICNPDVVKELGLDDEYEKIYDKETVDKIIYMREEHDADLFIGMNKNMQESTVREIANLINNNVTIDFNYLQKIKENTGYDIAKIAKDLKEAFGNKE